MNFRGRNMVRIGNLVFEMPTFIQEFGYREHHNVPVYNPYQEPTVRNYVFGELHEIIEHYLLYPLRSFIQKNDGRSIKLLDIPLGFIWGFVCGFKPRDIFLHTVWTIRGCPAHRVWKEDELLEVLLERDMEEAVYNAKRQRCFSNLMKMAPYPEGKPQSLEEALSLFTTGIRRQSLMILDNLGISINTVRGWLIYALKHNVGFDLSWEQQSAAMGEQMVRQSQVTLEDYS